MGKYILKIQKEKKEKKEKKVKKEKEPRDDSVSESGSESEKEPVTQPEQPVETVVPKEIDFDEQLRNILQSKPKQTPQPQVEQKQEIKKQDKVLQLEPVTGKRSITPIGARGQKVSTRRTG